MTRANVDVEMLSERNAIVKADAEDMARIIGRGGRTIESIERKLGVKINVRERESEETVETLEVEVGEAKNHLVINVGERYRGKSVEVYAGDSFLFRATVGARGDIRIERGSELGKQLRNVSKQGVPIRVNIGA